MKQAIEFTLADGRRVLLVELSLEEEKRAAQLAAKEPEVTRAMESSLQALRLSIRKIDDQPVKYEDFMGDKLEGVFGVRNVKLLARAYQRSFDGDFETFMGNGKATSI